MRALSRRDDGTYRLCENQATGWLSVPFSYTTTISGTPTCLKTFTTRAPPCRAGPRGSSIWVSDKSIQEGELSTGCGKAVDKVGMTLPMTVAEETLR